MNGLVTLLTDFGWQDPWVAEVKGALYSAWARWPADLPRPRIVDLCHDIPVHDVPAAAWFLNRVHTCYPVGTVHLAVVDPGVGGERPALALRAGGHFYVGPGNGLLTFCSGSPDLEIVRLNIASGAGHPVTGDVAGTFHGRDLFAPAAAALAMSVPLRQLGAPGNAADLGSLPGHGAATPTGGLSRHRIVWIDRFGNAISNLVRGDEAARRLQQGAVLRLGGREVLGPVDCFERGPVSGPFWYWGSGGALEVAMRERSVADDLGLQRGLALEVSAT